MSMQIARPRLRRPVWEMSDSVEKLMPKFAKAQSEFEPIVRDREEQVLLPGSNSKMRTRRFASANSILRSCLPALNRNGLVLTSLYNVSERGHQQSSALFYGNENIASVLDIDHMTYVREFCGRAEQLRKYSIQHLLGVSPDDDDDGVAVDEAAAADEAKQMQNQEYLAANLKHALAAIDEAKTVERLRDIEKKAEMKLNRGQLAASDMDSIASAIKLKEGTLA